MKEQIYLDNNATTKPCTSMMNAVMGEVNENFGNPSSLHHSGRVVKDSIEEARGEVAKVLKTKASNIIFTSGGTEANSLALTASSLLVCSSVEHPSIRNYKGAKMEVRVDAFGALDIEHLTSILEELKGGDVVPLVSIMLVNNETGVILDPDRMVEKLKEDFVFLLHVDAVQAFGKLAINLQESSIDFLSISAHKCHGLNGVGALYVNRAKDFPLKPLLTGGPQESGFRSGTENHIGILSLGYMATKLSSDEFYQERVLRVAELRDLFEDLLKGVSEKNGRRRVGNTSNLYFPTLPEESLELFLELMSSKGVFASGTSACSSGMAKPSHVLEAMFGEKHERVGRSIRFSLSVDTTRNEIETAVKIIKHCLTEIREDLTDD